MPKVGTAYVSIRARLNRLEKDLADAKTMTTRKAKETASAVDGVFKKVVGFFAIKSAAFGTIDLFQKLIKSASDLNEQSSKFSVVFRGQTDIAEQWSQTLVDAYGMSTRESKQYLASIQDLLVPMGMAQEAAGRMSNKVVKLATDLGSFNNVRTEKVMLDIQSALVGNFETMKKYGVVLNETVVKQEALSSKLAGSKREINASVKAQAAYNLIVKGSQAAIGDFSRTSDGYANTTKRLNAAWEEISSTIGEKFVGAAALAKSATADLLNELDRIIKGPSIEDQIAATQARIDEILSSRDQRESQLQQKRIAREERHMKEVERFVERNTGLLNTASQKILDAQNNISKATLKLAPDEAELLKLRTTLGYLEDIKRLQGLTAHEAKKKELSGFGVDTTPGTIKFSGFDTSAADARRMESLVLKMNKDALDKVRSQTLPEYKDLWQAQAADRLAVQSRTLDVLQQQEDDHFGYLGELSQRTADAMEDNFSDFFYQFKDGVASIEDLWGSLTNSMWRMWSDLMGQMMRESLFGTGESKGLIDSLIKWMGSDKKSSSGGTYQPGHDDFHMANGGYLGEGVRGIGLTSGRSYEFHPNEIVTPVDKIRGGSGINVQFNIDNQSGVDIEQESVSVMQPSLDQVVANVVLKRKMTSRSFRNAMGS